MTTRLFKLLLAVLLCAQTPLILSAQTTEGADDYSASIAGCNAFKAKSLMSPTQAAAWSAQSLLQSDDASHRMAGSEVLAELNSTASIELIHKAMERATDSSERSFHYSEY
jgi:hypothetical protein